MPGLPASAVKPELLAPAGSWEALRAAISNGADAVYMGGKSFSARQYAANFTLEELQSAVDFAHRKGTRVYVTVNTLIANRELEMAAKYLYQLYQLGIDAVIIQDVGVLALLRRAVPRLEIHASTQMSVTNREALRLLASQGVQRVVLAREMSLREIRQLAQEGVELEFFVHGALCIAYSGQCLFSSLVGGRSGNRGQCAQPCRLPYNLETTGKTSKTAPAHLLSTKDLNLVEHLQELAAAGVTSYKIEGRMKRPEYVAVVTRVYREAIDQLAGSEQDLQVAQQQLSLAFNRGFTKGYLRGNPGADLMGYGRPSNRGAYLGRVAYWKNSRAGIELKEGGLRPGDGIEVWVSQGGRVGTEVRTIWLDGLQVAAAPPGTIVEVELLRPVRPGDRVFKNRESTIAAGQGEAASEPPRQALAMLVEGAPGRPLQVTAIDAQGRRVTAVTAQPAVAAQRHPLTEEVLRRQLGRLGDTPYQLAELDAQISGAIMVPVSILNQIRRDLVEQLRKLDQVDPPLSITEFQQLLAGERQRWTGSAARGAGFKHLSLSITVGSYEAARKAVAAGADRIYLGGEKFRHQPPWLARDLAGAINTVREAGREAWLALPRIWHPGEARYLHRLVEQAVRWQCSGLLVSNLGSLQLGLDNRQLPLHADFSMNVFNGLAVDWLFGLGVQGVTLSPELNLEQLRELAGKHPVKIESIVHGALPLMVSAHCPVGAVQGGRTSEQDCNRVCHTARFALRDRLQFYLPIDPDRRCRMHLFNPKMLTMLEHLIDIKRAGIQLFRIEGRREHPDWVQRVVAAYRRGLDILAAAEPNVDLLRRGEEQLSELAPAGITRGHYYRGVG